jgi:hypothetical protein
MEGKGIWGWAVYIGVMCVASEVGSAIYPCDLVSIGSFVCMVF